MSDGGGTCEYVLNPDDPETWGGEENDNFRLTDDILNDNGLWCCPHDSREGDKLCIFHKKIENKKDGEVLRKFIKKIESDEHEPRQMQFLGAKFGNITLDQRLRNDNLGESSYLEKDYELYLSYSKIKSINFFMQEFHGYVDFTGVKFEERSSFQAVTFHENVSFTESEFDGSADFSDVKFRGDVWFTGVEISNSAYFNQSEFNGYASFEDIQIGGEAIFFDTDFADGPNFKSVNKYINLEGSNFQNSNLTDANFRNTNICSANFESALLSRATLLGVDLRGAKLAGAVLGDVRIDEDTQFLGHPDDDGSSTSYTFSNWLSKPSLIYDEKYGEKQSILPYLKALPLRFLLSVYGIILFIANLVPQQPKENFRNWVWWLGGRMRCLILKPIEWMKTESDEDSEKETDGENAESDDGQQNRGNTETDGDNENQDDNEDTQTDGGNRREIGDQNDPVDKDKAKSVYRALEELGGKAARSRLQSQAFVRRQDVQKREYKRRAVDGSLRQERVIGAAKYLRAKVARVTLLYGESPWRIIGISGTFVVFIGLLYPLFGWVQPREDGAEPITWSRILDGEPHLLFESIYFSALTFTTLGMGDYEPVGGGGQVLATFNTAFGAILVALLVFVLGRRAAR